MSLPPFQAKPLTPTYTPLGATVQTAHLRRRKAVEYETWCERCLMNTCLGLRVPLHRQSTPSTPVTPYSTPYSSQTDSHTLRRHHYSVSDNQIILRSPPKVPLAFAAGTSQTNWWLKQQLPPSTTITDEKRLHKYHHYKRSTWHLIVLQRLDQGPLCPVCAMECDEALTAVLLPPPSCSYLAKIYFCSVRK